MAAHRSATHRPESSVDAQSARPGRDAGWSDHACQLADQIAQRVVEQLGDRIGRERPGLLSVDGVADLLGLSRRTVWKLVSAEQLPGPVKIPGTKAARWRRVDLERWLDELEKE